ncbi:hypothetical protein [Tunturiibacter psychrotolerans]|uniref:hypothetical protein n=1 Tax=Tunturiibacter psychrotolerans TaxID=3069686 RepID=UPI003D2066F1
MDDRRGPVVAGFGGAALAATFLAVGLPTTHQTADVPRGNPPVVASVGSHADITSNQDGPWYAFCQEYASTEFDHGEDPAQERGIKGHHVPEEAEEGTVEITRQIRSKKNEPETEKFNVRKHMVGDLSECVPDGDRLRVVIAMVPDPNATQMRLDFDRDIVAIQSAAAAKHYLYTRYWFPWRPNDWTPDKANDSEAEIRRHQEPGILCFRKEDGQNTTDRLFVLMVGETPTSGANRIQLAHALYYAEQLNQFDSGSSAERKLDIAGPHFSASFKPIQDVLKRISDEHKNVSHPLVANLVSPDASGQDYIGEFQRFCSDLSLCRLRTLTLRSDEANEAALGFLGSLGYSSHFVAELSEDESAFGNGQFNPVANADGNEEHKSKYGLQLHFPRDLSSLRTLSDEESARILKNGSKYINLPGNSMPIKLAAPEPIDRDSPPAFGSEQEAAEVASSLTESVQEMLAHRIRAVVISASNPLDRIYLLEYLHTKLPDIRVVTIDTDMLELDRPHFVDLTGTLAVSAIPTISGMSDIYDPGGPTASRQSSPSPPLSFESSRQAGEFLTVETLLEDNTQAEVAGTGESCFLLTAVDGSGFRLIAQDKHVSATPHFPCFVAQSSANPNGTVDHSEPSEYLTPREHTNPPGVFLAFLFGLLCLNAGHLRCLYGSRRRIDGTLSYPGRVSPEWEPHRLYLLFVINNQLMLLNLLAARLGFNLLYAQNSSSGTNDGRLSVLLCPLAFATEGTIFLSCFYLVQFIRSHKKLGSTKTKEIAVAQMLIASVFAVWTTGMIFSLNFDRAAGGILLDRFTQLGGGLSPVLPITVILVGYFLWGCTNLRRLDWANSRKAHLVFAMGLKDKRFHARVHALQICIDELTPTRLSVQGTSLLLAAVVALLLRHSVNGFDGNSFYVWFLIWGVGMLLLTVAMTCYQAWSIWDHLRKLLDWLEMTPMADAFKRIGDDGTLRIKIWDLVRAEKSLSVLRKTVESIDQIKGAASSEAKDAQDKFDAFVEKDAHHRQLVPGQIDSLSGSLNILMDSAAESLLSPRANRTRSMEDLDDYLALRLVALVRYAMLHIGLLICFVAYGYVLAVLSVMFYAFEGRSLIQGLLILTLVALLIGVGAMMVQFQRNGMLSRLESSAPGQVNYGQLLFHLLAVGGLPLIALLTSQFPSIANFAYSFLRPLLH